MKTVMQGFAAKKGDRGEFVVMLFFVISRDAKVGPPDNDGVPLGGTRIFSMASFVADGLFRGIKELRQLDKDFPHATMHFNHYIKVHEFKNIRARNLLLLGARGAAVLCGTNQRAIDIISIWLCTGTRASVDN